ncbi:MAG: thiamine pyrophosphate-binding protein [Candidatus Freyarchaeota archaeon]|nr:thiamine pyrophosphate-binding protein [Candidatus Jordarchaeia archaeon]
MSKRISGGELLVRCLLEEGVRYIFGVPGAQLLTILDAVKRIGEPHGMNFVTCRHEQAAANMADAWARVTGEPGVCIGTVGPGGANLIPGVYPAWADGVPMIVLTAQNQTWRSYPDHGSMQALDQYHLFKPITKWNAVVSHWDRIPELVQHAFRVATSGRPGPVHLDLPADVMYERKDEGAVRVYPPHRYRATKPPVGDPELVEKAADMLVQAEMPLIHPGGGVLRAGAWREVVEIAEHLGAPVITTLGARGVIPEDHPLCLLPAEPGAIMAQNDADVVLAVGSRMGDVDFWGKAPVWGDPDRQKTVQVDVDPTMIGYNRPVDLAIVGDAKPTLAALLEAVKRRTEKRKPHPKIAEYKKAQEEWMAGFLKQAESNEKPIHPLRLMKEVRSFYPRDAIACLDGGNTPVWAYYLHHIYEPRSFLWAADSGHLGVGLPYAIGAKLAAPDRQVYLITGDGAFGTNIQELETASRLGVKITVIVVNDRAWGMIKGAQKISFKGRYIGVDFSDVRYDKIAQGMNWYGERVEEPEDIAPALERAEAAEEPALLDVVVSQEAHLTPPDLATLAMIWLEGCTPPEE